MNTEARCIADDEGRRCHRDAVMLRPVALCTAHRIEVALTIVPEVLRDQLAAAQQGAATAPPRLDLTATAHVATLDALLHGVHDSVVYFIANGGRVKIGYTTNLRGRLGSLALRSDSVLLALHGGPELERALHAHFAAYRNGNTEWFELAPEVFRYIAQQRPTATGRNTSSVAQPDNLTAARELPSAPDRNVPSLRTLRSALGVGQKTAQHLQRHLAAERGTTRPGGS